MKKIIQIPEEYKKRLEGGEVITMHCIDGDNMDFDKSDIKDFDLREIDSRSWPQSWLVDPPEPEIDWGMVSIDAVIEWREKGTATFSHTVVGMFNLDFDKYEIQPASQIPLNIWKELYYEVKP